MPKTLEELLSDSATADNVELTIGDSKVTIGQLRELKKARDLAASAKTDYDTRLSQLTERQKAVEKMASDSLALYEEANKMREEGGRRAAATTGDIDWENDPVYKPIHARLSKMENEALKALDERLKKFESVQASMVSFGLDQYYRTRWNSIPEADRPKDKTYKDYVKMAQDLNIFDDYKLPDPVEAWNRSTAESRRAAEIEAARKRGIEEGKKQAAAATLPRPGSTPTPRPPSTPQYKDLSEAMNAARKDPEILRLMDGEGSLA